MSGDLPQTIAQVTTTTAPPSPYQLNASDNPGALISSVILQEDNYAEWATELQNSLIAKQKLGFIDSSTRKPTVEPDLSLWRAANSMIAGWIRTSIDPKLRSTVSFISDASTLWESLRSRFSVSNGVRKQVLKDEIADCKQNGQSVLEYYGSLSKLWEELQHYKTGRECTCAAAPDTAKEREDDRVHQFLFGLDLPRFSNIRSTITGEDPKPPLTQVYSRVIREEQNLNVARSKEITKTDAVGFNAKTEPLAQAAAVSGQRFRDRSTLSCTHYHRQGHDNSECFLIHGFPDWYYEQKGGTRPDNKDNRSAQRGGRASKDNRRGHGRANNVRATSPDSGNNQITQLINLLEAQRSNTSSEKLSGKTHLNDVVLDIGASHHMNGDISILVNVVDIVPSLVTKQDGKPSRATKRGSLPLSSAYLLTDVLFVPDFNCTLISVSKLLKQTGSIGIFTDSLCFLQDRFSRTLIGAGEEREGVYYFTGVLAARSYKASADIASSGELWHRRLGHPSHGVLLNLSECVSSSSGFEDIKNCDTCFRAKQTREVFHDSNNKASDCFSLVHCDVWGPYRTPSTNGATYFLTLVDDHSRAVWTYLMSAKSEVSQLIRNFCAMTERQFGKPVKLFRTDNGTEFMCLSSYFLEHGILHETSCVDTPQQNRRVERKHRHILNVARACLFHSHMPVKFWGENILTATHLINCTPSSVLKGKTPYEILYGKRPSYGMLRTFGCLCYVHTRSRDKVKFGPRSKKCVFVGYPYGKKAWRIFDLETEKFLQVVMFGFKKIFFHSFTIHQRLLLHAMTLLTMTGCCQFYHLQLTLLSLRLHLWLRLRCYQILLPLQTR